MNKKEILKEFGTVISWLDELRKLEDQLWLAPIAAGKWSTAEIIAHFILWDRYVMQERLPHMKPGAVLRGGNVDVQEMNQQAAVYAGSGVTKEALIEECKKTREQMIACLHDISDEDFFGNFTINEKQRSIAIYVQGLIEHDLHHCKQIDAFIRSHQ